MQLHLVHSVIGNDFFPDLLWGSWLAGFVVSYLGNAFILSPLSSDWQHHHDFYGITATKGPSLIQFVLYNTSLLVLHVVHVAN